VYANAIQSKYLTAASPMDDSPVEIPVSGGLYRPKNYDHKFHDQNVTVRSALASSLNVPAVRTLQLIGVDTFVRTLRELGFENLKSSEFYGPSLALGSADITLWDLVNAYRVLAQGGVWSPLRLTPLQNLGNAKETKRRVYTPEVAFIISDILSDRESRSLTFGLENALALSFWSAVKTGTSKDMRDNWCVGYSDQFTVGVWVGNFSGSPMWNVSGITGAAPAWSEIMKFLHRKKMGQAIPHPSGVTRSKTPDGEDWFLRGTEPDSIQNLTAVTLEKDRIAPFRISYPVDGMVIARDPDIPFSVQKVFFEANFQSEKNFWLLNGVKIGSSQAPLSWEPMQAGNYKLSLVSEIGRILDTVYFFVR
jgi:penicillin-binding protein 1C